MKLLKPYPDPFKESVDIESGESIVGELQPALSNIAGCLNSVAQIIAALWTPL